MSTPYPAIARRIWSLASSGKGTTLSADGDSGGWTAETPDFESALDLRFLTDLAVMINVGGINGTPSFNVALDLFDDQGNLYPNALKTSAAITAAGQAILAGGLHSGAAGTYLVLPEWGRISWTCSGGSVTGTEISVYGR